MSRLDTPPGRCRRSLELLEQFRATLAKGDERDAHLVELIEVGIGRELGVEDELLGELAGAGAPELDEAKDLVALVSLCDLGVRVAEHPL